MSYSAILKDREWLEVICLSVCLSISISLTHHQVILQLSYFPSIQQQGIQGLQMIGLMEKCSN